MSAALAVELTRQAFLVGLTLALPPLLAVLVVGLGIGILQAATSVQEYTLTFVPKVLIVFAVLLLLGGTGLGIARGFMVHMLNLIPRLVP